jgi:hypothetical protein
VCVPRDGIIDNSRWCGYRCLRRNLRTTAKFISAGPGPRAKGWVCAQSPMLITAPLANRVHEHNSEDRRWKHMHKNRRRSGRTPWPPLALPLNRYVNNDVCDAAAPRPGHSPRARAPGPRYRRPRRAQAWTPESGPTWGRFEAGRPVPSSPPADRRGADPQYDVKARYVPRQRRRRSFSGSAPVVAALVRFVCSVRHHMKYCI